MRKNRAPHNAIDPARPTQRVSPSDEKQHNPPPEPNLWPQRVTQGARFQNPLLDQILAQAEHIRGVTHWGINE